MRKCRFCNQEIDSNAKVCRHCQARQSRFFSLLKTLDYLIKLSVPIAAIYIAYLSFQINKSSYDVSQSMKAINNSTLELNRSFYDLNNSIAAQNTDLLKAKQLALVDETRSFLQEYMHNILVIFAEEHNKVLRTDQGLRSIVESNKLSQGDYVKAWKIEECIECNAIADAFPDERLALEKYFESLPTLKPLEPAILDPERTKIYLDLVREVNDLSKKMKSFLEVYKRNEMFWVKAYIMNEVSSDNNAPIPDHMDWFKVTLYERYQLAERLKQVRRSADAFLGMFPEFGMSLKYIAVFDANTRTFKELEVDRSPFVDGMRTQPIKKATILLTKTYYKFDYYEYFVRAIESKYLADKETYDAGIRSGKINGPQWIYYRGTVP